MDKRARVATSIAATLACLTVLGVIAAHGTGEPPLAPGPTVSARPMHDVTAPAPAPVTVTMTATPEQTMTAMTTSQEQAVTAAQEYLDNGTGFSRQSLIAQLTSPYGNQFTRADAVFAVNTLDPNWNAQAVDAARGYLQMGGFSRQSLIAQLTSPYGNQFTEPQATQAATAVGL